ncbi:Cullin-2, partial [Nowakowskiella sp. JEL0078]
MVSLEKYEDCSLAFQLLSRIPDGTIPVLNSLEAYVTKQGTMMIEKIASIVTKDPKEYFESLRNLYTKYMSITGEYFANDPVVVGAVQKAFKTIMNLELKGVNPSESLARIADMLLKKSVRAGTEDDIDSKLDFVNVLFKFLDDKDVFQKFYSRAFAKRLIYATSQSDDAELTMINKLKAVCGVEYTNKLQRMYTDTSISAEMSARFSDLKTNGNSVDFAIMVLTAGSWPLSGVVTSEFELPIELGSSVDRFALFYTALHNGRKLTWLHHLAKADIRLNGYDKRYEINMSVFQLAVLLQFNNTTTLTITELSTYTKLAVLEVRRIVKSFVDIALLLSDNDVVSLNLKFTSKRVKIKLGAVSMIDSDKENDETRKAVDEDRKLYLQATIVRIMKSRKLLSHNELVTQTIEQSRTRFVPAVAMIKRCIEVVLEKNFLTRCGEGGVERESIRRD